MAGIVRKVKNLCSNKDMDYKFYKDQLLSLAFYQWCCENYHLNGKYKIGNMLSSDQKTIVNELIEGFSIIISLAETEENVFDDIFNLININDERSLIALLDILNELSLNSKKEWKELFNGLFGFHSNKYAKLLASILASENKVIESFYNPYICYGNLIMELDDLRKIKRIFGAQPDFRHYVLLKMNLIVNGVDCSSCFIKNRDIMSENAFDDEFDVIGSILPLRPKQKITDEIMEDARYNSILTTSQSEYYYILDIISHMKEDSVAGVVISSGRLYSQHEREMRKYLIENNYVSSVIKMPVDKKEKSKIIRSLLILKNNSQDVLFINGIQEDEIYNLTNESINEIVNLYKNREEVPGMAHVANIEEIKSNDYNLNVLRYTDNTEKVHLNIIQAMNDLDNIQSKILAIRNEIKDTRLNKIFVGEDLDNLKIKIEGKNIDLNEIRNEEIKSRSNGYNGTSLVFGEDVNEIINGGYGMEYVVVTSDNNLNNQIKVETGEDIIVSTKHPYELVWLMQKLKEVLFDSQRYLGNEEDFYAVLAVLADDFIINNGDSDDYRPLLEHVLKYARELFYNIPENAQDLASIHVEPRFRVAKFVSDSSYEKYKFRFGFPSKDYLC